MFFGFDFISGFLVGLEVISGSEIIDGDGAEAAWGVFICLGIIQITIIKA